MNAFLDSVAYGSWILHALVLLPLIGVVPVLLGPEATAKRTALVVTTLAQGPGEVKLPGGVMEPNGVTWLDRAGNYLSPTATVVERFTKVDDTHINYTATITDPEIYTRPWTISMPLYKHTEPNAQLLEFRCVPFSEMLLYGDLLEENSTAPAADAPGERG